jgi:hypothetical protein
MCEMFSMSHRFSDLPVAMQLFFGSHEKDEALLSHVFAPDAAIIERGLLFKGSASIALWCRDFEVRYPEHWFEAIKSGGDMRRLRVRMRLRGAFPGSPLELRFRIAMRDHRIAAINVLEARGSD